MHINAHRAGFVLGVLMVVQYGELRGTAQGMPSVRVIPAEAKVFARPEIVSDVVMVTHAGAVLDLIDKREGWYWILLGRDQNGSRQPGWIQANQVAIATAPTSRDSSGPCTKSWARCRSIRPVPDRRLPKVRARKGPERGGGGSSRSAYRRGRAERLPEGRAREGSKSRGGRSSRRSYRTGRPER